MAALNFSSEFQNFSEMFVINVPPLSSGLDLCHEITKILDLEGSGLQMLKIATHY